MLVEPEQVIPSPPPAYVTEVLEYAEAFVASHSPTEEIARLLGNAFIGLRHATDDMLADTGCVPYIELPIQVCAAVQGGPQSAIALAAATSLLYLGLDIFDDIADGDLPAHWQGYPITEINLAAAALLSALPQLVIADLPVSVHSRAAMQREIAAGLLIMAAGQQQDVSAAGQRDVTTAEVESSIARKSGEELGMFAALGALLANGTESQVQLYREMGRAFGTAAQLASDCYDIFVAPQSKDLASGSRTLPIVMYLERAETRKREEFHELLNAVPANPHLSLEVRGILRKAGVLRRCAVAVEVYCSRARRHLKEANPPETAAYYLDAMITSVSLFGNSANT